MSEQSQLEQRVIRLENQVKVLRWVVFFGFGVIGFPLLILLWPLVSGVLLIGASLVFVGLLLYPLVESLRGAPVKTMYNNMRANKRIEPMTSNASMPVLPSSVSGMVLVPTLPHPWAKA